MTTTTSLLADLVASASARGASYADARTVEREQEGVNVKDGAVESVTRSSDRGLGFRVIHKGSWGFAATDRTDDAALRGVVDEAFRRAEAAASVQRRTVTLAAVAPQRGEYRTTLGRDPFAVPLAERIDHLREVDAASKGPRVKTRRSSIAAYRTRKHLVTSEGTDVSQEIVESGAGLSVLAVKAGAKPA
ncbi:MAG: TldD/PmbA family protein, partial [Chloroflexi bacterium]